MNKQEILDKVIEENPRIDFDSVTVEMCDTFMGIFYLNKVQELGLIESDVPTLTGNGFDVAMTMYENGWKVGDEEMMIIFTELFGEPIIPSHPLILFCANFRDEGFDAMKKKIDELDKRQQN